jgi:hypothetical protein
MRDAMLLQEQRLLKLIKSFTAIAASVFLAVHRLDKIIGEKFSCR